MFAGDSVSQGLLDGADAAEVVDMAEQLSVSSGQAMDLFRDQGMLDDFIGTVTSDSGFVDYRGPFAEGGALLLVEPGFERSEAFRNPPPGLVVWRAEASADEREAGQREVEMAAELVAASSVVGVAYDAFDNSYTVWVEAGKLTSTMRADIKTAVAASPISNLNATVQVTEVAADWSDAYGGVDLLQGGSFLCTTTFGVVDWPLGGYLTAGHCDSGGTYSINGNQASSVQLRANGGYLDRVFIVAGGSSWMVQVTSTLHVDMNTGANKHIYLGNWYNHWGQGTNANSGGIIDAVNVSAQGRWLSTTPAVCGFGDSGGPVYLYVTSSDRRPKGLVSAAVGGFGACAYVALDDQLAGTGWTLL